MAAKSYWEKLKDPKWQKKRLEILERDDFTCTACGDKESPLHVHHGFYDRGCNPWEYENKTLWTLCESCHEEIQDRLRDIHYEIAQISPRLLDYLLSVLADLRTYPRSSFRPESPAMTSIISSIAVWMDDIEPWCELHPRLEQIALERSKARECAHQ